MSGIKTSVSYSTSWLNIYFINYHGSNTSNSTVYWWTRAHFFPFFSRHPNGGTFLNYPGLNLVRYKLNKLVTRNIKQCYSFFHNRLISRMIVRNWLFKLFFLVWFLFSIWCFLFIYLFIYFFRLTGAAHSLQPSCRFSPKKKRKEE